jgi:penicillin amidase
MVTTGDPAVALARPSRWGRAILLLAAAVVAIASAGALYAYWIARSALPQLDGELQVAGLSAAVTITRDAHGVPTIIAANLQDLFFAQGFVTAQDRLWQMDASRRFAGGELAEILGPDLLKHDREARIMGLSAAARKAVEVSSPEILSHFEAYARGVNACINTRQGRLPVEFRLLGYAPRPWTPQDSMLVAAQMVENLTASPRQALEREQILARLGPELTADLYVNSSWHDHPPTAERHHLDENSPDDDAGGDNSVTQLLPGSVGFSQQGDAVAEPFAVGSNNWVVSGAHTTSGKPLLSNDMHLAHQMPGVWYEAHLKSGNFDVAGVTLPGLPYVIVGHNQRIAWGFTNIGPTVEDVYIETFNGQGQYLTPAGWKTPDTRHEVIQVKGQAAVNLDVVLTRHGPIVTELVPGETRKLALRWTLYDGIHNPFFAVDSAQNWDDFRHALSNFDAPAQNAVYADVDGNIGYQATGKIPIRASGDGSLPENGSDDAHEWTGYIPFDKLPSAFNPDSGILATANGRITPDDYPYSISTGWEAPWRTDRIYRVLESGRKFSPADMLALQTDIYSEADRYFAEQFVYSVDHAAKPTPDARQAADLMRQWDGRMTADSAAPTIETRSRQELIRLLLEPKLGPASKDNDKNQQESSLNWKSYRWGMQSVWLENVLSHHPQRWLPSAYTSYEELLATAVEQAVHSAPHGQLAAWKWGKFNAIEIQNPVLGRIPLLRRWTGTGIQTQSGSAYTVKAVTPTHGPSERMTVDLSALDQSTLNVVTGESGNFLSPYYLDQWKAWYEGYTFPLAFSDAAVEKSRAHRLVLKPR